MNLTDAAQALAQRRRDFAEALDAVGPPEHHRLTLTAACEAVAKARAVCAVAQFVDTRRADPDALGPN